MRKVKSRGKIRFHGNNFLGANQWTGTNITKNENEPHTAKPSFSVVLKHFRRNSLKTFFCFKKVISQNEAKNYSEIIFSQVWKGANVRSFANLYYFNVLFIYTYSSQSFSFLALILFFHFPTDPLLLSSSNFLLMTSYSSNHPFPHPILVSPPSSSPLYPLSSLPSFLPASSTLDLPALPLLLLYCLTPTISYPITSVTIPASCTHYALLTIALLLHAPH